MVSKNNESTSAPQSNNVFDGIANVAHDLKTPLASFMTGLSLIRMELKDIEGFLEGKLSPSDISEIKTKYVEAINQQIKAIQNMNHFMIGSINRVLETSKASKGLKLVPKFEYVSLADSIQLPLQAMASIQENHSRIVAHPVPKEIKDNIVTDKQWLQENILCLLSNSYKYSSEGSIDLKVTLEEEVQIKEQEASAKEKPVKRKSGLFDFLQKRGSKIYAESGGEEEQTVRPKIQVLRFEIEDHGIGMSEENMKNLFSPFTQNQRLAGGTGLGLYSLAKRIEALGGSYGVMGRKDGDQGSVFWFTIPYRPEEDVETEQEERDDPAETADKYSNNTPACFVPNVDGTTSASFSTTDMSSPPISAKTSFNILLADDSPTISKTMKRLLEKSGHQVTIAENGDLALKLLENHWKENERGYDVILMDMQMPVMDGLEATKRIRSMEQKKIDAIVKDNNIPEEYRSSICLCGSHPYSFLIPKSKNSSVSSTTTSSSGATSTTCSIEFDMNDFMSFMNTVETIKNRPLPICGVCNRPVTCRQVIIATSANDDDETVQLAKEHGVDDFLVKPFPVDKFHKIVRRLSMA